jgi:hypothetical protein
MNDIASMEQERTVLRWGGLAGVLGGIVFILVFIIVAAFVGTDTLQPEEWIERFPDIRAARTVENSLYLVVLVLWIPHYLTLYRALRGTSLAPALFGSALGMLGLVMLMAGALPHVATAPLSDFYHAPGVTAEDQASLVLMWQATEGIFDALLITGLVILPIGHIALGLAMLKSPAFGRGVGRMSVLLGAIGTIAAGVLLIDPLSPIAVASILALIIFHLVVGWRVYKLSRAPGQSHSAGDVATKASATTAFNSPRRA